MKVEKDLSVLGHISASVTDVLRPKKNQTDSENFGIISEKGFNTVKEIHSRKLDRFLCLIN